MPPSTPLLADRSLARSRQSRVGRRVSMVLALLSVGVYTAAALSAQRRDLRDTGAMAYAAERSSLAAAVTHAVYREPLGSVSSELLKSFLTFVTPIGTLVEQAANARPSDGKTPGDVTPTTRDGNGLGYVMFATMAMRAFGPHLSSIVDLLFLVMALSALAFAWRFPDERLIAVPLFFSALTVMLFGPLSSAANRSQFALGGIRYFSVVAVLPALHLFLEMADSRPWEKLGGWAAGLLALGIQVTVLTLAVLVRNSGSVVMSFLALTCIALAWRRRGDAAVVRRTLVKGTGIALVTAALVRAVVLPLANYTDEGRIASVVWHRVFISLGVNPAWPFGNMPERYACTKYIPDAFASGASDRTGHCVWLAYALQHHVPLDEKFMAGVYGGAYERVLRDAFLDVARTYPMEVLKTFVWYKPLAIKTAILAGMHLTWPRTSPLDGFLLVISIGLPLACGFLGSALITSPGVRTLGAATGILGATLTIPPLIAWANTATTADLVLLCWFGVGLLVTALVASARQRATFTAG